MDLSLKIIGHKCPTFGLNFSIGLNITRSNLFTSNISYDSFDMDHMISHIELCRPYHLDHIIWLVFHAWKFSTGNTTYDS